MSKIFPSIKPSTSFRTKECLVDYSDTDDEESPSDCSSDDGTIDISDVPPPDKVTFLPETIDGLRARFEKLLKNIAVNRKSGTCEKTADRNEVVFLLDELKRQGGISQRMYKEYNDFLAESPPVGFGVSEQDREEMETDDAEREEEDQLKKEITSAAEYLVKHDKKELLESVSELQRDGETIDIVSELEVLITAYLEDEFLERESVAGKVHELLDQLSKFEHVPKSTLLKIKMLLGDIVKNRARVKEIVTRFSRAAAGDDKKARLWTLAQLAKEELLSEQQYFKLAEMVDEIDIEQLIDVIKETKIGEGIDFLPRKTEHLIDTLREWMQEFTEKGGIALQNRISSVLNELLRRKTISEERYNELKEENDIL